jgi:hypothetical protein
MTTGRQGLALSQAFYEDLVRDIVRAPHAAGLLGEGSEVLGYDDERSRDHAWGPRVTLFVEAADVPAVSAAMEERLPETYDGWPVRFYSWQSESTRHHVDVVTLDDWLPAQLKLDPRHGVPLLAWLTMPQQHLLQVTAGGVWHDDSGVLTAVRQQLAWYPSDVWMWLMASQWRLVGTLEPQLGRMAELDDDRGARVACAQLAQLLMRLCFLQERRYWPYPKWFGTAFAGLDAATDIGPLIDSLLAADGHLDRERARLEVTTAVAARHNSLRMTPEDLSASPRPFEVGINGAVRPYEVLDAGRFERACRDEIEDPGLRALLPIGSIDQLTHADDALINFTSWPQQLTALYAAGTTRS